MKYDFLNELGSICNNLINDKDKIIICVTGMKGSGKSTFGKYVRKNGFSGISKYKISVIDDGVMSMDIFYIFNKRVKIKSEVKDELEPFLNILPKRKKIIFYVSTTPQKRLSFCDILLELSLPEDKRIERLKKRDKNIKSHHFINCKNIRNEIVHDIYIKKELND